MTSEQEKGLHEIAIFKAFAAQGFFNIDLCSIKKCLPPKPDLLCQFNGTPVYFELARNYPKEFEQQAFDVDDSNKADWGEDSIERIISAKLNKCYQAEHPVQLLIYDDLGVAQANDVTTQKMRKVLSQQNHIQFERIWYFAQGEVIKVWDGIS